MRAIVGAIGWNGSDFDSVEEYGRLAAHSAEVGAARSWRVTRTVHATFGCSTEPTTGARRSVDIVSGDRVVVLADVRLVERGDLLASLDCHLAADASDVELVHASYLKWGADFAAHLHGDFSAVVYDELRNEAVLATGGSGARQLYFSRDMKGTLIASVAGLIQRGRRLGVTDLDVVTVRDYLLGQHEEGHRTFFTTITRVPPGHRVILSATGVNSRRFWTPPERVLDLPREADYLQAFADLFQRCVSDSIDPGATHVVHLSGGLDSSSIVEALSRTDGRGAAFEIMTAVYSTIPSCNETAAVAAVIKGVPFPCRTWDAEKVWDVWKENALTPWPLGVVPTAIANYDDFAYAAEIGAVAVLSGDGGDALTVETAVFRDLVRNRHWHDLWNELSAIGLRGSLRRWLIRQCLHEIRPRALTRQQDHLSTRRPWFGPALMESGSVSAPTPSPQNDWGDLVQRQVWSAMTDPTDMWVVETMNQRAWRSGIELRCPFRDTRLTTMVAAIPYRNRLCHGVIRRLQRVGLKHLIPTEVSRRLKTDFTRAMKFVTRKELEACDRIWRDGRWFAAPYVERRFFDDLRRDVLGAEEADTVPIERWYLARRIGSLETWLRSLAV